MGARGGLGWLCGRVGHPGQALPLLSTTATCFPRADRHACTCGERVAGPASSSVPVAPADARPVPSVRAPARPESHPPGSSSRCAARPEAPSAFRPCAPQDGGRARCSGHVPGTASRVRGRPAPVTARKRRAPPRTQRRGTWGAGSLDVRGTAGPPGAPREQGCGQHAGNGKEPPHRRGRAPRQQRGTFRKDARRTQMPGSLPRPEATGHAVRTAPAQTRGDVRHRIQAVAASSGTGTRGGSGRACHELGPRERRREDATRPCLRLVPVFVPNFFLVGKGCVTQSRRVTPSPTATWVLGACSPAARSLGM